MYYPVFLRRDGAVSLWSLGAFVYEVCTMNTDGSFSESTRKTLSSDDAWTLCQMVSDETFLSINCIDFFHMCKEDKHENWGTEIWFQEIE